MGESFYVTNRLIAIGDIHGCSTALRALITAIAPEPNDTIVTLGDYVDRGPDVRGVVDQLLELQKRCKLIPILGNHEEMMLRVIEGKETHQDWLRFGGVETLESYGFDGDLNFLPPDHMQFSVRCKKVICRTITSLPMPPTIRCCRWTNSQAKCCAGIRCEMASRRPTSRA